MTQTLNKIDLKEHIRDIPDFPKEGILFKDISTLLKDKAAFRCAVDSLAQMIGERQIDTVVAVEARGFIFGSALAYKLGCGFVPVRKKGKLPAKTRSVTYQLEYGTDTLEVHEDAIEPGQKVLVVDDLLATGGTVRAACDLLQGSGATIAAVVFLVELGFLRGREKLQGFDIFAAVSY